MAIRDAIISYADAGLADPAQVSVLRSFLSSAAAERALADAVTRGAPLGLDQVAALAYPDVLEPQDQYVLAFGALDPRINEFALPPDSTAVDDLMSTCVDRGSPMTDAEIEGLNRAVLPAAQAVY